MRLAKRAKTVLQGIDHEQTVYDGSHTFVVGRGGHGSGRVTLNERRDRVDTTPDPPKGGDGPPEPEIREAHRGCPDAERLAEYADGLLDAATRATIEAHLVTCADCRSVLVETMAFLAAEGASARGSAGAGRSPGRLGTRLGTGTGTSALGSSSQATPTHLAPREITPPPQATLAQDAETGAPSTSADAPVRVVPFRTRSWVTGVGATLAAAAALVLIVRIASPAWLPSWLGGGPPLEALVAALDTQRVRPVEGRLMGGFAHKPAPSPTRGGTDRLGRRWSPEVDYAAANIARFAEGNTSARARAALGVALIVDGDLDAAVTALEQAAKDLAGRSGGPHQPVGGLSRARPLVQSPRRLAEGARRRRPRHHSSIPNAPEPYFNRALALEGLEQTERAAQAWGDYAARDRDSAWTREAEERRKALPE